jgi:protein TonB
MPRRIHFIIFLLISLGLHVLVFAAVFFVSRAAEERTPLPTPVQIVNLPPDVLKRLPQVRQAVPRVPQREAPPRLKEVPKPKKFGTNEEVKLPKTMPPAGKPSGAEGGKTEKGKAAPGTEKGPLPFLTQADIDELARKGMPSRKPGDDSVTLDTDEFKFISYNRWLKIKVESALRYPELAAQSGMQGVLYIRFDIMKDGSLGAVELLKSSGYKILDDEALRAIRSSAPFQSLPDDWNMERYSIRAAVLFYLSEVYVR